LSDGKVLCDSDEPTCEVFTLGRAEEKIELSVFDIQGFEGVDTVSIFHKKGARCGNSTVEPPEVCDTTGQACQTSAGYWGTQQCNSQCTGYDTCTSNLYCGDGQKNGNEVCDGGSQACTATGGYAGTQTCNTQCNGYNTCTSTLRCGDGICSTPETSTSCPADCTTAFNVTLEAENMTTKTIGGPVTGGWVIWANGYIESTVNFPTTGTYRFDIIARGKIASGVWPNMELRIDQSTKANFTVNTTGWATYTANASVTAGSRKVAIAFTNDLVTATEDRNLYVDKVTITK
jgi:hypothetical protein